MKGCELCTGTARMYCESDAASLCFDCDAKVHGANFLVARHSRVLLCRTCQAPTPWKAEGPRLGPTVSVCDRCFAGGSAGSKRADEEGEDEGESGEMERLEEDNGDEDEDEIEEEEEDRESGEMERLEEDNGDEDEDEIEEEEEDRESEDEEEEEEEEGEGEEQVVPWSMEPPPVASSSSSEGESAGPRSGNGLLKRMRQNVDLPSSSAFSQDQLPCSSSSRPTHIPNRTALWNPARSLADDEVTSESFRPLKDRKKTDFICSGSHQLSVDFISFASARPPV